MSLSRAARKRKLDTLQASRTTVFPKPPRSRKPPRHPRPAATIRPSPAELAALHAARDILSGKKPTKTSKYGGPNYAQQLNKRIMVQTMQENAARNASGAAT